MKTKEFMGIISRDTAKDNNLILNVIEYSCIPFNSWFETHSRLQTSDYPACIRHKPTRARQNRTKSLPTDVIPSKHIPMGSLLNASRKMIVSVSRSYSVRKQQSWHFVGDGQTPPAPNKLGIGERVTASDFCHTNPATFRIP